MKKIYERPEMMMEGFRAEEFCSVCGYTLKCDAWYIGGNIGSLAGDLWRGRYPRDPGYVDNMALTIVTGDTTDMPYFYPCNNEFCVSNSEELTLGYVTQATSDGVFGSNSNMVVFWSNNDLNITQDLKDIFHDPNYTLDHSTSASHHTHATAASTLSDLTKSNRS